MPKDKELSKKKKRSSRNFLQRLINSPSSSSNTIKTTTATKKSFHTKARRPRCCAELQTKALHECASLGIGIQSSLAHHAAHHSSRIPQGMDLSTRVKKLLESAQRSAKNRDDLLCIRLRVVVVVNNSSDYFSGDIKNNKKFLQLVRDNIDYVNQCYNCQNEDLKWLPHSGPYAFRPVVGNPRIVLKWDGRKGDDLIFVKFDANDFPLREDGLLYPHRFINKYLPRDKPFQAYHNLIISELPDIGAGPILGLGGLPEVHLLDAYRIRNGGGQRLFGNQGNSTVDPKDIQTNYCYICYEALGAPWNTGLLGDYGRGGTMAHEMGHSFGLYHLWDAVEAICDTPPQKEPNIEMQYTLKKNEFQISNVKNHWFYDLFSRCVDQDTRPQAGHLECWCNCK
eukprot:g2764.t1